jgi:hypothetical protein
MKILGNLLWTGFAGAGERKYLIIFFLNSSQMHLTNVITQIFWERYWL